MAVFRPDLLQPIASRRTEVPELTQPGIEGLVQEREVATDRARDRRPDMTFGVEDIGHQGSCHIVGAIAVTEIRDGTDRMLGDAKIVTQATEVPANRRHSFGSHDA